MRDDIKRPLAGFLACVASLVLLTLIAYGIDPFQRLDATALSHFGARGETELGSLAGVLVHLADPLPLLAMLIGVCGLALYLGRRREALAAVLLVAGANVTTQVLKIALAHPRYQPVLGEHQLGPIAFPSGHSTAAASIALALLLVAPRAWKLPAALLGACFAAAVGASILVSFWHYPSDVLGGALVASAWYCLAIAGLRAVGRAAPPRPAQPSSRAAISVK